MRTDSAKEKNVLMDLRPFGQIETIKKRQMNNKRLNFTIFLLFFSEMFFFIFYFILMKCKNYSTQKTLLHYMHP